MFFMCCFHVKSFMKYKSGNGKMNLNYHNTLTYKPFETIMTAVKFG